MVKIKKRIINKKSNKVIESSKSSNNTPLLGYKTLSLSSVKCYCNGRASMGSLILLPTPVVLPAKHGLDIAYCNF